MPVFQVNQQQVLFLHIPKTAGASLEAHLRLITKVGLFCGDFKKLKDLKFPCSPQHFHLAILHSIFPRKFFDWRFTIVRHPLDRIKSEYRMRRGLFMEEALAFPDWIAAVFERYAKNPYVFDNHIRPQVEFVENGIEIFRFEQGLGPVLEGLSARFGLPAIAPEQFHKQKHPALEIDCPPDCEDAIRRFYQADYETLGY